jgi:hypothetical protein
MIERIEFWKHERTQEKTIDKINEIIDHLNGQYSFIREPFEFTEKQKQELRGALKEPKERKPWFNIDDDTVIDEDGTTLGELKQQMRRQ